MVYVMAPDGQICQIPDTQLAAALAEGGTLVTERHVSDRNQRQSMQQHFFEQEWKRKRPQAFRLKRRPRRG